MRQPTGQENHATTINTRKPARDFFNSLLDAVVEHRLPPGAKLTEEQLGVRSVNVV